jgi:hypothetical protein
MSALSVPPRSPKQRQDYQTKGADEKPLLCSDAPPSVELTAGEQEKRAVLSLCFNTPHVEIITRLSTPWEDDADNVLADLDGLANATRIDLSLGWHLDTLSTSNWTGVASLRGAYGVEDFDVLSLDLTEHSVDRDVWSAGASFAFGNSLDASRGQAMLFTYRREHGFENDADDQVSVCVPVVSNAQRCKEGFLGPPGAIDKNLATLEYRFAGKKIGFLLKGTYDFEDDIYGVELPVYLTKQEGKFNGGFKLGWRDDTDDVTLAVFVGIPLDVSL